MEIIKIILWAIIAIIISIYLYLYLIPLLKRKWTLWVISVKLNRMAKKYPNEEGEKLREIAKGFRELAKNEDNDTND